MLLLTNVKWAGLLLPVKPQQNKELFRLLEFLASGLIYNRLCTNTLFLRECPRQPKRKVKTMFQRIQPLCVAMPPPDFSHLFNQN